MSPDRRVLRLGCAAASLLALAAVSFAGVRPTNFGGSDEWLIVSLLSQGILSFPYANRPLNLIWAWPAWTLFPDRLFGFLVFHVLWIGLGGVTVFLIARRLLRGATPFAFLAGALTIGWAPSDGTRLCSVQMILYSGCTFGVLIAVGLATEAWSRRRVALAAGAAVVAGATVLSLEAALLPLALLPLLLLLAGGTREPRRLAAWSFFIFLFLATGGVRAALPLWTAPGGVSYQAGLAEGLKPGRLVTGSLRQLRHHLAPLVQPPASARAWPAASIAFALFAAGFAASSWRGKPSAGDEGKTMAPRRSLILAAGLGCLWALASYLPFAPTTRGAFRTQFLSAPGVAVLLASGAFLVASLLPGRARLPAAGLLGAGIVALGVLRTAALQDRWDTWSPYPAQRRALLELTAIAPALSPGTLVVLLPRDSVWPFDLTFRHAVRYLYEGQALGHVVGADPLLYETRWEATGMRCVPVPVIRGPWREAETLHPFNAVVALREDAQGRLSLLETWPAELPPLPSGARYDPRARLLAGPRPRRLTILRPVRFVIAWR